MRIQRKLLQKLFDLFIFGAKSCPIMKQKLKPEMHTPKRFVHTRSTETIHKFKSMTEKKLNKILEEDLKPADDFFQDLKSSLQNKALRGEGQNDSAKGKNMHKKNAVSFANLYINKGSRKDLIKSSPDSINGLVVVSSSSISMKDNKMLPMFVRK